MGPLQPLNRPLHGGSRSTMRPSSAHTSARRPPRPGSGLLVLPPEPEMELTIERNKRMPRSSISGGAHLRGKGGKSVSRTSRSSLMRPNALGSSRPSSAFGMSYGTQRRAQSASMQRPGSAMMSRPGSAMISRPGSAMLMGSRPLSGTLDRPGSAMSTLSMQGGVSDPYPDRQTYRERERERDPERQPGYTMGGHSVFGASFVRDDLERERERERERQRDMERDGGGWDGYLDETAFRIREQERERELEIQEMEFPRRSLYRTQSADDRERGRDTDSAVLQQRPGSAAFTRPSSSMSAYGRDTAMSSTRRPGSALNLSALRPLSAQGQRLKSQYAHLSRPSSSMSQTGVKRRSATPAYEVEQFIRNKFSGTKMVLVDDVLELFKARGAHNVIDAARKADSNLGGLVQNMRNLDMTTVTQEAAHVAENIGNSEFLYLRYHHLGEKDPEEKETDTVSGRTSSARGPLSLPPTAVPKKDMHKQKDKDRR
ncbi:hypothetical protein KIPB_007865, partial [Kipferlia bialata]|eukprot:g7865.t1